MPVISLPEYLGLQEAPQQPVFNRTRQLEPDNPWARTMEVADSLTALRQQRPMAQIQAIQNEYDAIRDNAEKLRREREVAIQAEQAVSALSRMTPDDPDYANQRRQFQQQLPMAQFDPRVNSILSDNDRIYAARQQAEAKRQQEIIDRAAELAGVGMNPQEAVRYAQQGPIAASEAKYRATRKPEQDQSISLRQAELKLLEDQQKKLDERMVDLEDPEYVKLDNEINQLRGELRQAIRGSYMPQTTRTDTQSTQTGGAQIPFRPAAQPVAPPPTVENLDAEARMRLSQVPANELQDAIKKEKAKLTEASDISKAWQAAKDSLESRLKTAYQDKDIGFGINPLEQLAMQIVNGQLVNDNEGVPNYETGALPRIPLADKVLRDLKIAGYGNEKAFTEPGSKRKSFFGLVGSQDVSQSELIRDWAEKFLKQRNLLPKQMSEETTLQPGDPEKLENIMNEILAGSEKP